LKKKPIKKLNTNPILKDETRKRNEKKKNKKKREKKRKVKKKKEKEKKRDLLHCSYD